MGNNWSQRGVSLGLGIVRGKREIRGSFGCQRERGRLEEEDETDSGVH
jgi:hypothetical protein